MITESSFDRQIQGRIGTHDAVEVSLGSHRSTFSPQHNGRFSNQSSEKSRRGRKVVHARQQDGVCLVLFALWEKIKNVKTIFADTAYGRNQLPEFVKATLGLGIELIKRPRHQRGFQVLPKRWIVERTFAWLGCCRRHSKDYERNPETSEAMIQISMIHLMLKRLAPAKS